MILAAMGWRIHVEDKDICASMWAKNQGDLLTVHGFTSRMEAWMFVAVYLVFITQSKQDKAQDLIREFTARVTH